MNSFYDVPRSAPQPTSAENVLQCPVVPEVSIIFQQKPDTSDSINEAKTEKYLSYNDWKLSNKNLSNRNDSPVCSRNSLADKENKNSFSSDSRYMTNSQIYRKQVRFESPTVVHQGPAQDYSPAFSEEQHRYVPENKVVHSIKTPTNAFEQIYMGNIPNRHLDLSIIDAKNASKNVAATRAKCTQPLNDQTNQQQNTRSDLCNAERNRLSAPASNTKNVREVKRNEPVTDVYNYRVPNTRVDSTYEHPQTKQNYTITNQHFSDRVAYNSTVCSFSRH